MTRLVAVQTGAAPCFSIAKQDPNWYTLRLFNAP